MTQSLISTPIAARASLRDETVRRDLARTIASLFMKWQLGTEEQMNLLGMSAESRKVLKPYLRGERALPDSRDTLDRAGYLLGIHKGLRLLFPEDEGLRYDWVRRRNQALDQRRPLDIMLEQGLIGIARVARLVDFQRGQ